jgi:hypothetical protein
MLTGIAVGPQNKAQQSRVTAQMNDGAKNRQIRLRLIRNRADQVGGFDTGDGIDEVEPPEPLGVFKVCFRYVHRFLVWVNRRVKSGKVNVTFRSAIGKLSHNETLSQKVRTDSGLFLAENA